MSDKNLTVHIYALYNPEDKQVFYIGATQKKLEKRLYEHTNHARCEAHLSKNKKMLLLADLDKRGVKPEIISLDTIPYLEVDFWEGWYMEYFRSLGFNLLNVRHSYYRKAYWRRDIEKRLYKGTWRVYSTRSFGTRDKGEVIAFTEKEAIEEWLASKFTKDETYTDFEGDVHNSREYCRAFLAAELLDTYVGRNVVYKKSC